MSGGLHPQYADVCATLAHMAGDRIVRLAPDLKASEDIAAAIDGETSCVIVQSPDFFGNPRDLKPIAEAAHAHGALLIAVFTDPVALGLLRSPGEMDADIAVGEGQGLGNALNFGGPYVGLFATRAKNVRQMPGRLAGETVDAEGRRSFVLTLSTREQHIRREKATSNICTNSGLCALAFSIHLTLLGAVGLDAWRRSITPTRLSSPSGSPRLPRVEVVNTHFFNEFVLRTPRRGGRTDRGAGQARRDRRAACLAAPARRRARRLHHRRQHRDEHRRRPRALRARARRLPALSLQRDRAP